MKSKLEKEILQFEKRINLAKTLLKIKSSENAKKVLQGEIYRCKMKIEIKKLALLALEQVRVN